MKKLIFAANILLCILSSNVYAQTESPVHLKDLKQLSDHIDNIPLMEKKIFSMGYRKRFNGTYISNTMLTPKAPKHWLLTSLYMTYSTADKASWEVILDELKREGKPKKFNTGTSQIGYRYSLAKYTIETYKPLNGVNLNLNDLYQVILLPKGKK